VATVVYPWRDVGAYVEVRLEEALAEFALAEKFLGEGLYRNAAGKAFQGWRARAYRNHIGWHYANGLMGQKATGLNSA